MSLIQTIAFVAAILVYAGGPIIFASKPSHVAVWYLIPLVLFVAAVEFLRVPS